MRGQKEIFYWRGKREVDFVTKNREALCAINVSYGATIDKREIHSLLEFANRFKKTKELILITKDLEKEESEKRIKFVPLWKWLLLEDIQGNY